MGNGAAVTVGGQPLSKNDFEMLDRLCRNQHFRDNFHEYADAFRKAIENDAIDILEILIPAGNAKRIQPLHLACKLSRLESAEVLISAGFSCMLQDELGRTPLHVCSTSKANSAGLCATLIALSSKKALVMRDRDGLTPLHLAAAQNNLRVIEALMLNGADITTTSASGKTAYQIAAESNNYEALQLLKDLVSDKSKAISGGKAKSNMNKAMTTSRPRQTQAEYDRIMQVWERFFENAFKRMGLDSAELDEEVDRYGASPCASARTVQPSSSTREYQYSRSSKDSARYMDAPSSSQKAYSSRGSGREAQSNYREEGQAWREQDRLSGRGNASMEWDGGGGTRGSGGASKSSNMMVLDVARSDKAKKKTSPKRQADHAQVLRWFEWVALYHAPAPDAQDPEDGDLAGDYYVLNTRTGETAWLDDHLAAVARRTLLPCASWGDYDLHMSLPLPVTLAEALERGWMTYYCQEGNTCYWISLPTKCTEAYLPVGLGGDAAVLRDLGIEAVGEDGVWCPADQTCSTSWVVVVVEAAPPHPRRGAREEEAEVACCYYRNRLTGATRWDPPPGWEALVQSWEGWTLCCGEDAPEDLYWFDFDTGEAVWAEA